MSKENLRETLDVWVESREPEARTTEYISTFNIVGKYFKNVYKKRMDIGDIGYENIRIELKSWQDFVNAITKDRGERFRNQLWNMWNNPELDMYYFIYGDWDYIWQYSEIHVNAILGALASIMGRYHIKCCIFRDKKEAIYTACKIIEKSKDHKRIEPQTFKITTDNLAVNMLIAGAERFQEKAAFDILDKLGTVKKVVNSNVKTLMTAKGLGKKTATRFFETINFDFSKKKEFEKEFEEEFVEEVQPEKENVPDEDKIEKYIMRIIKETGLSRNEIEDMTLEKQEQLKGMLSMDGALILIMKELAVDIEFDPNEDKVEDLK